MTWEECAPQNDNEQYCHSEPLIVMPSPLLSSQTLCCHAKPSAVMPDPHRHSETLIVIPNGVRNLRYSFDGLSISTTGPPVPGHLRFFGVRASE